jgi:DNA-binding response OmpR family regulator
MDMRFLLLNKTEDKYWETFLREALAPLGKLDVRLTTHEAPAILKGTYGLIVVDATATDNIERLVSRLRADNLEQRIVVMSASPTWMNARAAFEAGAIDYLPKTLGKDELQKMFKQLLTIPLPPWPR